MTKMTKITQTATSKGVDCWICGNHGRKPRETRAQNIGSPKPRFRKNRKNGVCNLCPYPRCGVDTEIPYRVRIVDKGFDCGDPVCSTVSDSRIACSPENFCDLFLQICLGIWHSKMVGVFGVMS